jgi:acyl dehydratase
MAQRRIQTLEELRSLVGGAGPGEGEVIIGDWHEVTQEQIGLFADATGDHQWIHIDPERARTESPFGTTIAHGFLTLSLLSHFHSQAVQLAFPMRMGINYGLNRVRFVSPVPAGSRIRLRIALLRLEPFEGGEQATWSVTVEREGAEKPACVVEWLVRYYL